MCDDQSVVSVRSVIRPYYNNHKLALATFLVDKPKRYRP